MTDMAMVRPVLDMAIRCCRMLKTAERVGWKPWDILRWRVWYMILYDDIWWYYDLICEWAPYPQILDHNREVVSPETLSACDSSIHEISRFSKRSLGLDPVASPLRNNPTASPYRNMGNTSNLQSPPMAILKGTRLDYDYMGLLGYPIFISPLFTECQGQSRCHVAGILHPRLPIQNQKQAKIWAQTKIVRVVFTSVSQSRLLPLLSQGCVVYKFGASKWIWVHIRKRIDEFLGARFSIFPSCIHCLVSYADLRWFE